ncbi:hypothetical protein QTP88_007754 [Uroleucon formosanum]
MYLATMMIVLNPKENEVNLVPQMQTSGLWADILGARNIVAPHVSSLIYNVNNNVVEGFNNVIAKYVGGKRINFSLRVDKMRELSRRRRLNLKKPTFTMNKRKLFSGPDDDYGAVKMGCEIIDIPFDEYQNKKELFLKKITLKFKEIVVIERSTIGQQDNDMWQQYRKYRLTASNFGKVCKLRPTTSHANTVKHILYDIFQGSSATRYGIENESIARNAVQETLGITNYTLAGFVIDKIPRDESFWNTKIEPFVTRFYMESLLPEIIDSRFDRGLPIRPAIPEKIV